MASGFKKKLQVAAKKGKQVFNSAFSAENRARASETSKGLYNLFPDYQHQPSYTERVRNFDETLGGFGYGNSGRNKNRGGDGFGLNVGGLTGGVFGGGKQFSKPKHKKKKGKGKTITINLG